MRDNGSGVLQIVQDTSGVVEIVETNVGTVDYDTGTIQITNLNVSAYTGAGITLSAIPSRQTLKSTKNIILKYNETPSVKVTQERV